MKNPAITEEFAKTYDLANKLTITGTPSYVVGSEVIYGALGQEVLTEKIAAAAPAPKPAAADRAPARPEPLWTAELRACALSAAVYPHYRRRGAPSRGRCLRFPD